MDLIEIPRAASAAFFRFPFGAIKIFALYVYIDVEVDENEEASAVCNQKAGRSVTIQCISNANICVGNALKKRGGSFRFTIGSETVDMEWGRFLFRIWW